MSKDPRRYTPQPYGHATPWSRRASEMAAAEPEPAHRQSRRWPWAVAIALVVAAVSWLVYDLAIG